MISYKSLIQSSIFLALVSCFLWSTAFVGIKIGLQYTSPLQFAGIRFMLSGILIFPFVKNKRAGLLRIIKHSRFVLLVSLFQTALLYTFFYLGINKTPAAIGAIIVGAGPLFVAFLAHFFSQGEALTKRKIIALIIGFSGIVMVALARKKAGGDYNNILMGIIMLVLANLAGSFGNVLVSGNKKGIPPVLLNSIQIFFGGLFILVVSFFTEGISFSPKPFAYYASLGWLSFLSAAAFTIWFVVLSRPGVKVSEINVWKFVIPILGAFLSWIIIPGENPQWNTLIGMSFTAMAIVIIYGKKWLNRLK